MYEGQNDVLNDKLVDDRQFGDGIKVFHPANPARYLPMISKDARLVVWTGVGAHAANLNYVVLEDGEANTPRSQSESEDTIHILEGRGFHWSISTPT